MRCILSRPSLVCLLDVVVLPPIGKIGILFDRSKSVGSVFGLAIEACAEAVRVERMAQAT